MKRILLSASAAALVLGLTVPPVWAQVAQADGVVGVFNRMIRQGSGSVDSVASEFYRIVDVGQVVTRVMGEKEALLSPEQHQRFGAALMRVIAADLSQTIGETGGRIEIVPDGAARTLAGGEIAQPLAVRNDAQNVTVPAGAIMARGADGQLRLIDVELNGYSVIGQHREAVSQMLEITNDPEVLIVALEEAVAAVAVSGAPVPTDPVVDETTELPAPPPEPEPFDPIVPQNGQPGPAVDMPPARPVEIAPVEPIIPVPVTPAPAPAEAVAPVGTVEATVEPLIEQTAQPGAEPVPAAPEAAQAEQDGAAEGGGFVQPRPRLLVPFGGATGGAGQ